MVHANVHPSVAPMQEEPTMEDGWCCDRHCGLHGRDLTAATATNSTIVVVAILIHWSSRWWIGLWRCTASGKECSLGGALGIGRDVSALRMSSWASM
jgi:hypothetical protein